MNDPKDIFPPIKKSESKPGSNIENREWEKFLPFDKYWTLRVGTLDILNGYKDINELLKDRNDLSGDILALRQAAEAWNSGKPIDVLECGTLYRMLQFYSWKNNLNKEFIKHETLVDRIESGLMTQDPSIVNLPISELLKLDGGTSQWATAAILVGNTEQIENPEYHIALTLEAVKHWKEQRSKGLKWETRYDETLKKQAETFLKLSKGEKPEYVAIQPDEYLFARTFGYMTRIEGEARWPRLKGHETNRFEDMDRVIEIAEKGEIIDSKDHRVVQAIAMWGKVHNKDLRFTDQSKQAVNKSWPQFWDFLVSVK